MNQRERIFIFVILIGIIASVGVDLNTDYRGGAIGWHLIVEGLVAIFALIGILQLLRGSILLRNSLAEQKLKTNELRLESEKWRSQSKKFLEGLSHAIDLQLTDWALTHSEREVTFLLLKGLSLKEIAEIRSTSEKTARAHAAAIYSKAGVAGRSELAAFFLEDLLPPQDSKSIP